MERVNRSWMALVAAALLLGTLAGAVWARPHERPQPQDITRKVTIAGGEFIVNADGYDWWTDDHILICTSGSCGFIAPVVFPCLPSVTVERIKLHATNASDFTVVYATLHRVHPTSGTDVWLGQASSSPGTAGLQTYSSPAIDKVVWPSQRAYIYLWIGGIDIEVYGVTVEYHRNI